jgi:VanZ family protein
MLVATIIWASGTNPANPINASHSDKLIHFLVFGLISILVVRLKNPVTWKWAVISFLLVSAFGALDEFRQSFTPGRAVEFEDWVADTLGAAVAVVFYKSVPFFQKILEVKLPTKSRQASRSEKE